MTMITVRNLPDEIHRALRVRAAHNGRSAEAEVREILAAVLKPAARLRMGDALAALSAQFELTNQDVDALEAMQSRTPAEPVSFE